MEDTCFDLLCKGMSAEDARVFRKALMDCCRGDENSFPVQMALLTRAQWRAAAEMPVILQKILVTFEAKLADQQKQMVALMRALGSANDDKIKLVEKNLAVHTNAMKSVADRSYQDLEEMDKYAREIRGKMEYGLRESDRITKALIDERQRLEETQHRYERSTELRETAVIMATVLLTGVGGFLFGWYHFGHPH